MLAIPPNRYTFMNKIESVGWAGSLARGMRVAGAFAALLGASQSAWCQSGSQQSAIHFVAPCEHVEHSAVVKKEEAPATKPAVSKPTFVPPLSISDYQNY